MPFRVGLWSGEREGLFQYCSTLSECYTFIKIYWNERHHDRAVIERWD